MLTIIGFIFVPACVIIGYMMHGGVLGVLVQVNEVVIICGAAVGGMFIASPMPVIKDTVAQIIGAMKDGGYNKDQYLDLLKLMFEIFKKGKGNMLSLEPDMEKPDESELFKRYPNVLKNHHLVHFIADTLKVQISSPVSPYDLEDLMNADMETVHHDEAKAPAVVNKVGDAMPGLGIVAAVLGIVITMGKLSDGKEVIGHSVAAALVGTFLGVLLSYGFIGPLASKMESNNAANGKILDVAKCAMLAFAKDCSPKVCVEFARRSIPPHERPEFSEVDEATANIGKAA